MSQRPCPPPLHHDARWFPEAERFLPERWTEEFEKQLPKHAYFPFGAGPRGCIGRQLAMMEATLFLTTILQRFKFTLAPGYRVVPEASLSLRPRNGVRGTLSLRPSLTAAATPSSENVNEKSRNQRGG